MNAWMKARMSKIIPVAEMFAADHRDKVEQVNGDVYFALWLHLVDIQLIRLLGVSYLDMPDLDWRGWYESDLGPKEALHDALDQWKEDGDLPGIEYADSL